MQAPQICAMRYDKLRNTVHQVRSSRGGDVPFAVEKGAAEEGAQRQRPLFRVGRPRRDRRLPASTTHSVARSEYSGCRKRRFLFGHHSLTSVRDEAPDRDQPALQGNHVDAADRSAISFLIAAADPTLIPATSAAARML
jgi:hypothetical protein